MFQEAAVFVLEKRALDKYAKKDRDLVLDAMRKGEVRFFLRSHTICFFSCTTIGQDQTSTSAESSTSIGRITVGYARQTRYRMREYCRDSLAFATESCFASLANCLGFYETMNPPVPKELEDFKLYDVEIRYGIVQVRLPSSTNFNFCASLATDL